MRNLIAGIVVGMVIGIVVGTTVVAPRLKLPVQTAAERMASTNASPRARGAPRKAFVTDTPTPKLAPAQHSSGSPRPSVSSDEQDRTRWRMASAYASTLAEMGSLAKRVEADIWKASDGRFRIEFFEPGTLVDTEKAFDAVRSGAIEAAFAAPSIWADRNPALHLFSAIPFGPPIQEYLAWTHAKGVVIMRDIYKKLGVRGMACGLLAPEGSGWFRKPVKSLDQLRAQRIGMTGLGAEVLQQLGIEVLPVAEGDAFVALERGLIDAVEAAQPSIDLQLGLHRMARHYYFPGWHQPATLLNLIINQNAWDKLGPAAQRQLQSVCGDNIRRGLAESEAAQFEALKTLTAEGVSIETWSPEILAALRVAWAEVVRTKQKKSRDFDRAWKSLKLFREEYGIWREIGQPANRP